jgi:hypothetical protein
MVRLPTRSRWPIAVAPSLLLGMLVCASVLPAAPARAAEKVSKAERAEARKLAGQALDLFRAGDFEAALDKFMAADEKVPAPSLKLYVARCLDRVGRMHDAAATYREVIATELDRFAPKPHREARKKAVPELAALLEEIPRVKVTVSGPGSVGATVTRDGGFLGDDEVGVARELDPGSYEFEARRGVRSAKKKVTVKRGDSIDVALVLPASGQTVGEMGGEGGDGEGSEVWPIVGWSAIGLGGAGVIVGTITGVMVLGEESDLEARCPNRQCPPEVHDDARSFDTLRVVSTISYIVGGVGLGAGTAILLFAPSGGSSGADGAGADSAGTDALTVEPYVTPFGAGIRGRF